MTIDEAIKILEERLKTLSPSQPLDCYDAIKLGMEALNYVQKLRQASDTVNAWRLPGETKD